MNRLFEASQEFNELRDLWGLRTNDGHFFRMSDDHVKVLDQAFNGDYTYYDFIVFGALIRMHYDKLHHESIWLVKNREHSDYPARLANPRRWFCASWQVIRSMALNLPFLKKQSVYNSLKRLIAAKLFEERKLERGSVVERQIRMRVSYIQAIVDRRVKKAMLTAEEAEKKADSGSTVHVVDSSPCGGRRASTVHVVDGTVHVVDGETRPTVHVVDGESRQNNENKEVIHPYRVLTNTELSTEASAAENLAAKFSGHPSNSPEGENPEALNRLSAFQEISETRAANCSEGRQRTRPTVLPSTKENPKTSPVGAISKTYIDESPPEQETNLIEELGFAYKRAKGAKHLNSAARNKAFEEGLAKVSLSPSETLAAFDAFLADHYWAESGWPLAAFFKNASRYAEKIPAPPPQASQERLQPVPAPQTSSGQAPARQEAPKPERLPSEFELWNQTVGEKNHVKYLTAGLRRDLERARTVDGFEDAWPEIVETAAGMLRNPRVSWVSLGWLLKSDENWQKVANGEYSGLVVEPEPEPYVAPGDDPADPENWRHFRRVAIYEALETVASQYPEISSYNMSDFLLTYQHLVQLTLGDCTEELFVMLERFLGLTKAHEKWKGTLSRALRDDPELLEGFLERERRSYIDPDGQPTQKSKDFWKVMRIMKGVPHTYPMIKACLKIGIIPPWIHFNEEAKKVLGMTA